MSDPNFINIEDKIAELEKEKWSCSWEQLILIQQKILAWERKLEQGITHEPAF